MGRLASYALANEPAVRAGSDAARSEIRRGIVVGAGAVIATGLGLGIGWCVLNNATTTLIANAAGAAIAVATAALLWWIAEAVLGTMRMMSSDEKKR